MSAVEFAHTVYYRFVINSIVWSTQYYVWHR